jgi:hypothetical protein
MRVNAKRRPRQRTGWPTRKQVRRSLEPINVFIVVRGTLRVRAGSPAFDVQFSGARHSMLEGWVFVGVILNLNLKPRTLPLKIVKEGHPKPLWELTGDLRGWYYSSMKVEGGPKGPATHGSHTRSRP